MEGKNALSQYNYPFTQTRFSFLKKMSISPENAGKMLKVEERAPIMAKASRKGLGGEKVAKTDSYQSTDLFCSLVGCFYKQPLKYRVF